MHELSIAESIVSSAENIARENGAKRVKKISLVIGALSGIEVHALTFCFPFAAKGGLCEEAELAISIEAAKGNCGACGAESEVKDFMTPCPKCQNWPLTLEGGKEMLIKSLEVE